MMRKY